MTMELTPPPLFFSGDIKNRIKNKEMNSVIESIASGSLECTF